MFATVTSLLISVTLLLFLPAPSLDLTLITFGTTTVATLFLLLYGISLSLSFNPLQRIEQNLTPRILQLFTKDRPVKFSGVWLLFFLIATISLALSQFSLFGLQPKSSFIAWVLLCGISFDIYFYFTRRLFDYMNPFAIVTLFTEGALKSIQEEHEVDLCDWIDALSEVAIKSANHHSSSLCNNAIDELNIISKNFFVSERSISHHKEDKQTKAKGIKDKVSYVLFFLLQRLEMLFHRSIERKIEPISSHTIATLGKLAVNASKCDMSLVGFPLEMIGKTSLEALRHRMTEIAVKASLTLVEVARQIIEVNDVQYLNLKEPFLVLNTQLEEISKELFRQNKSLNIRVLMQPFAELQEILHNEKLANHQDKAAIYNDINRILDEFVQLQAVMRTVPPSLAEVRS